MSTTPTYSAPPTSTLAIVSLVLGLLSWIMIPVLGGIGAVICGHMARREIRDARGAQSGDGLALSGLILGYAHLVVVLLGIAVVVLLLGGFAAVMAAAAH